MIYLVNIARNENDPQIYMQSFCEAWIKNGGNFVEKNKWQKHRLVRHMMKAAALLGIHGKRNKQAYIICARGKHLLKASLPYAFHGEIIPMLWDCWPYTWDVLERDIRLLKCKTVFITASDVVNEMSKRMPEVNFVHVPEGVDINDYISGDILENRSIDIFELGDKHYYYHKKLMDGKLGDRFNFAYSKNKGESNLNLTFNSWDSFTKNLADTKILIAFPLSLRNPRLDGTVETLTIRYWEGMLSRCIILGHCPKELIDLVGYNPVIEVDFVNPVNQIENIITNISNYQQLVDKNYDAALKHASWNNRMKTLKSNI